jgi:hypothetical protein
MSIGIIVADAAGQLPSGPSQFDVGTVLRPDSAGRGYAILCQGRVAAKMTGVAFAPSRARALPRSRAFFPRSLHALSLNH